MRIRYIGAHDAVTLPLPSGIEVEVARGGECDVPDVLGASLLEQAVNWEAVKAPTKAAAAAKEG
jgi:hypothetical protein